MLNLFTSESNIEPNAKKQLDEMLTDSKINKIAAFPDIHYCSEKGIPVGLAFSSQTHIYPLITGNDMGCGVAYLQISKKFVLKPFSKKDYKFYQKESETFTDEGLGGGNHFLSLEEDDENWYIICHTGTRNLGIYMFQQNLKLLEAAGETNSIDVDKLLELKPNWFEDYQRVVEYGKTRRAEFCYKFFFALLQGGYIDKSVSSFDFSDKSIKKDFRKIQKGSENYKLVFGDSVHNHIRVEKSYNEDMELVTEFVHRKGATDLSDNDIVVIPLSMTRGSLFVKKYRDQSTNINSCSHGAGRKLSRTDTLKFWNASLKKRERQEYAQKFEELLDRNGKFPNGYIQEFDFAYKDSDKLLEEQPFLKKVTETKPIVTFKFTEI